MIGVLVNSWALFLGMFLLMLGNGMQGTLLGIRGGIEGFGTVEMSYVMSGYFVGFLGGSRLAPLMIRRVGHIRVFSALASLVSAVLILYPTITEPWAWGILRIIFGFCFSGIYVTSESWLNNAATNETRGQSLSIYTMVQMGGIILAQYVILLGDPSGFVVFILPSVLVSLAVAPILLSVTPTPAFGGTKPMSILALYRFSPLAAVGAFMMGGIFAAQFGMSAVYGTEAGFTTAEVVTFASMFYVGAIVFQYPVGWLSDRMDRRVLLMALSLAAGLAAVGAYLLSGVFPLLLAMTFLVGGFANPIYPLVIAYLNDYLDVEDMAAGSGAVLFLNGLGAIAGPIGAGYLMQQFGTEMFWAFLSALLLLLAGYGLWRMQRRPTPTSTEENVSYVPITPMGSSVALEAAQEQYVENVETAEETA
ncbi:MAG: MFS transporter [Paracoccaceae bacterium]|nr:MFS transporter [Paracoccaceae bacterium]